MSKDHDMVPIDERRMPIDERMTIDERMAERSLAPMLTLYDGTEVPFGDYDSDGNYHLHYTTTSKHGCSVHAIYGVAIEYETEWRYKIFIGEAPHKDAEGNWTTYNNVPSFMIGAFGGAHYLKSEPDVPHLIRICSDEWDHDAQDKIDMAEKRSAADLWKLRDDIRYCTFKMYIKGLWHRMQRRFGTVSKCKGKHSTIWEYRSPKNIRYQIVNHWKSNSFYLVKDTPDWVTLVYFKENGKVCFRKSKYRNDGCYTEA